MRARGRSREVRKQVGSKSAQEGFSENPTLQVRCLAVCRGTVGTLLPPAIPVAAMRSANYMVDRDENKATPDQAATWLERQIGLR